ncbi:unnamed protein product [Ixodes pacificus]
MAMPPKFGAQNTTTDLVPEIYLRTTYLRRPGVDLLFRRSNQYLREFKYIINTHSRSQFESWKLKHPLSGGRGAISVIILIICVLYNCAKNQPHNTGLLILVR